MKNTKVYIVGRDYINWSIDKDRENIQKVLTDIGCKITYNILDADIIFVIWWNILLNPIYYIMFKIFLKRKAKVVAVITNDISYQKKNFEKIKRIVDYWVCANTQQIEFLLKNRINAKKVFYNPFYVNEKIFRKVDIGKEEICNILNIDYSRLKGKFLIGSFQRDSLGKDLSKPKWQKNPELLVKIIKMLIRKYNKDVMLVLAGPRRHYIIRRCEEERIPYIFVGDIKYIKNKKDDIKINNLPQDKINLLYNLVDLYIITSKSEGGPKAVIEAALTETPILSTKVGMAPDLLCDFSLYSTPDEAVEKILLLLENKKLMKKISKINYKKVFSINNYEKFKERINLIISEVSKHGN